jgi:hypothetical protein
MCRDIVVRLCPVDLLSVFPAYGPVGHAGCQVYIDGPANIGI